MALLPIFPLGTVLLPGGVLPLRIFEPRYVQLLADLSDLPAKDRVLGIVAIRHGFEVGEGRAEDLYDIGCLARVEAAEVVRGEGGPPSFRVVVQGLDRLRVEEMVETDRPYPTAEISVLHDESGTSPVELHRAADRLVSAFVAYRRAVAAPETQIPGPVERVGAQILSAMPVSLADRQRVLEAGGAAARLSAALILVQREADILGTFGAVAVTRGEVHPN